MKKSANPWFRRSKRFRLSKMTVGVDLSTGRDKLSISGIKHTENGINLNFVVVDECTLEDTFTKRQEINYNILLKE